MDKAPTRSVDRQYVVCPKAIVWLAIVVFVASLSGTDAWAKSVERGTDCRLVQRKVQLYFASDPSQRRVRKAVRGAIRGLGTQDDDDAVSRACRWCVIRQFRRDVPVGSQRPCGDHDPCVTGGPLPPDFGRCVSAICRSQPHCCSLQWTDDCVELASEVCDDTCEPCPHDECSVGSALSGICSPCVETMCATDPYCCDTSWDEECVARAETLCGKDCGFATTTSSTLAPVPTVTLAPTTTTAVPASTTTTFETTTTSVPPQCWENLECSDGNVCTDDYCLFGRCAYGFNRAACSDGKLCTIGDTCLNGSCIGGMQRDCNDGNACTIDFCHATSGECRHQQHTCVDTNPCTNAVCDPQQGCLFPPIDCDDSNPATVDSCDPASGCVHTPAGTP